MLKLQIERKRQGYSQEFVSKQLGLTQQAYARYEKEDVPLPQELKDKLEEILMCDLTDTKRSINSINGFLDESLTAYHAVENAIQILEAKGFHRLNESEHWSFKKNGKYYITKNNSSIIAFKIGDLVHYAFNIASCHTDSPCLKIKGNSLLDSPEGKRINVERYGSMINYSFMDIPLAIAGRICVETKDGFEEKLYKSNFSVNVPSLCIHHNPNVNGGMELNNQVDMLPLLGNCKDLYSLLNNKEKILDGDLFCVPVVKSTYSGANGEFLVSPRIDNLSSLFAIAKALTTCSSKGISVLYASDNEEIGSLSKQGAESSFLKDTLKRINDTLGKNSEDFIKAIENGFVLSIDNGHATHPNHSEKSDPDQRVYLNRGVVIKHHPNYSTDGVSSSIVKMIAKKSKVPVQDYYNRSDVRCGSTIGLVTSSQLAIKAADIGLAQLAMHSGIETVGKYDIQAMIALVKGLFETIIKVTDNKISLGK